MEALALRGTAVRLAWKKEHVYAVQGDVSAGTPGRAVEEER